LVFYLVMYITSYSIRIVLLSRYVNIYDTMAPMSVLSHAHSTLILDRIKEDHNFIFSIIATSPV